MERIDTYLIDRSRIFREGLKKLLPESEFNVVGEADAIGEATSRFGQLHSGIVLTEYPAPETDEVALLESLGPRGNGLRRVVFAPKMNCDWLRKALAAGADGFLLKEMSFDALLLSLRLVLAGAKVMPSELSALIADGRLAADEEAAGAPDLSCLSDRERHVLQALVQGHSNKIIARELQIAEGTVKVHLKGVLKKLNLRNRTQAAVWALNSGIGTAGRALQ
jgi:two-component system, NarL family, nitrate/nitrite response regulator NarL